MSEYDLDRMNQTGGKVELGYSEIDPGIWQIWLISRALCLDVEAVQTSRKCLRP